MLTVSAPGKLMLSGEWSVLELGVPCIVLAIDRKVKATIEDGPGVKINAKDLRIEGIEAEFDGNKLKYKKELSKDEKKKLVFAKTAIELALRYLKESGIEPKGFEISTDSEITFVSLKDGSKTKVGFGSSAAAVVAIIGAVLKFHGLGIDSLEEKERVYKLGCAAHYFAQGKVGSAFDVAASTYGGALVYKRFDPEWLTKEIESGKGIKEIVGEGWSAFEAKPIKLPDGFRLVVGFTGYSASTKELVLKMREFKKAESDKYWEIINSIKSITEKFIKALEENDKKEIYAMIEENRKWLKKLAELSGNNLETEALAVLADVAKEKGCAGKFSGAGAGDCGIAVCFDEATEKEVRSEWEEKGLYPLDVKISEQGVH